jgi:SAM-dependent methyltransferase
LIDNTDDYVSLMRRRATGALPDMGCALRVGDLLRDFADGPFSVLDVGCAAGHFLRTFKHQELPLAKYVGLEIDPAMFRVASEVWEREAESGLAEFINADLEKFSSDRTYDFVICVNAFMYFASAKTALTNLLRAAKRRVLVRSYFADSNYRIIRAQTSLNHDKSSVDEIDVFDESGNIRCYDYWNIYSRTYIESLVARLDPSAEVDWIEDKNVLSSLKTERELDIKKRGATELLGEHEVSYPFILPWKWLSIRIDRR